MALSPERSVSKVSTVKPPRNSALLSKSARCQPVRIWTKEAVYPEIYILSSRGQWTRTVFAHSLEEELMLGLGDGHVVGQAGSSLGSLVRSMLSHESN
jgi:hypothetical protein